MTTQEIENFDWNSLSEVEKRKAIKLLSVEANIFRTQEQGNKLVLNSIYGAMANRFSYFYDKSLAEAITLQGQDAIRYSERVLNHYFHNIFHKDKKVLSALKEICPTINTEPKPCTQPFVVYMDTDSVDKDTIIKTDSGELTIEELYNQSTITAGKTLCGHESVETKHKVLNWSEENGIYYANVKRVIKHKVTKQKWKLKTKSGKEVIVTNDHSMIVFRDGKQIEVKPSDILIFDFILTVHGNYHLFEAIDFISCIGEFKDEYVYDIEVDDSTHTFIANDILVHNSCYVSFEEVAKKINWTGSANDLILTIDKVSLADYLQKAFDAYAKKFNTDNYLSFELETIGDAGIWAQKKKYVQSITWEDGKVYDKNEYIKTTGLEIVRKNTPPFCRPELIKLVGWIFDKGKDFSQRDITIELLELKKRFSVADTEEICFNTGIGDYEKYVLEDKDDIKVADGCGAHIRAAAIYNYYLHNNPEFKTKYERLKTGDSVRWYYAKTIKEELNVFAFKRGSFPKEFAPEIDIDLMFEKTIINPLNNIIKSMEGIDELQGSLKIKRKLF
jgi:hypothetical protein